jgi:hypothetical protein
MLFLIITAICFLLQLFLPWWIITPLAFGAAFWKAQSPAHAFWSGFFAVFTLWIMTGLFYSVPNDHILANRVGAMLGLPDTSINWIIVLLITGLIGGLAAGFCSLAGYFVRQAMVIPEKA